MALVFESTTHAIGITLEAFGLRGTTVSTLTLTLDQWQRIRAELHEEHPNSVFMLKSKMRRVLGFTVREHNEWVVKPDGGYGDHSIRLDFYNERKYTMFMLKFSEHLKGS
jgi:hypothetical protein